MMGRFENTRKLFTYTRRGAFPSTTFANISHSLLNKAEDLASSQIRELVEIAKLRQHHLIRMRVEY